MSLTLLFHLMLNVFWMLIHPSSGACDLFVELFHGLYCSGSMCVGVTVWFGWGGVVVLQPASGYQSHSCELSRLLVKKFPAFSGSRKFITVVTTVRDWALACA